MTPSRLKKLRHRLPELDLDAILISNPTNRRYLSGFSGSAGYLFITAQATILATDFRYIEQARTEAPEFEIFKIDAGFDKWLPQIIQKTEAKNIGFESDDITIGIHQKLTAAVKKMPPKNRPRLIPSTGIPEALRAIKDESEIELIRKAIKISDAALAHAAKILRDGMTEKELAWELERFMRENGSQSLPFEIIVASGPNGALPHAKPSERRIKASEPVVIDLGAKVDGYTSDITRTLWLDKPSDKLKEIYPIVRQAQKNASAGIKKGMSGKEADELARKVIEQAGYGDAFGHGLGHGVGMETHEAPTLSRNVNDALKTGMVFTVEPGIYLPGWGGVRIEDMVLLESTGPRVITEAEKLNP